MPKFDSPIGSKQFHGQPMRDLSVPDDSGYDQPAPMPPRPGRPHQHSHPDFDEQAMREFQSQMQTPVQVPREMTEAEMRILEAKKAKREGRERLSDGAKRRIEILIGMTRLTRDVDVDGKLYRLQTLKSKELREALVATAEFDGTVQLVFETRKQLLARSLVVVAGVEIEQFLSNDELQSKLDFIEEMDHALLLRLYNEYISLSNEAQEKYALKTVDELKEVADELKK
jgi:hypothetical protein